MSAIVRNIVNQAYQLSGIISLDEVAEGNETAMAIIKLNELLAQLNTEQLFPYSRKVISYTVPTSKLIYTIGVAETGVSTSDIVEQRPAFINRCFIYPSSSSNPMNIQQLDLPDLINRQLSMTSTGYPMFFAVNPSYPYTELHFDIMPSAGTILKLVYNTSVEQVTINTVLSIPMEYNDVLVTGLARKVAVLKQMPEETISLVNTLYNEAISRIVSLNQRTQIPTLDGMYGAGYDNILCFNAFSIGG